MQLAKFYLVIIYMILFIDGEKMEVIRVGEESLEKEKSILI